MLVTGAGPIGLLAALLGAQRGLDVHVLDLPTKGAKPQLVHGLDATYHHSDMDAVMARVRPDVVIEATGAPRLVFAAMRGAAPYGITVLTGVSSRGRTVRVDAGELNRDIVLDNDVVVGSVNANLRHYAEGRRGAGRRGPRLARPGGHPAGPAGGLRGRLHPAGRRREGRADLRLTGRRRR